MKTEDELRELREQIRLEWCDVFHAKTKLSEDDPMWAFYDKGCIEKIAQMAIIDEIL